MGMDVYGKKPTSPEGEYFRRSIWGWHPLAEACQCIAPDECAPCKLWHSNDGDGLDAEQSAKLATVLETALKSDAAAEHVTMVNASVARSTTLPSQFKKAIRCTTDDVAEFAAFVRASGGFEIR